MKSQHPTAIKKLADSLKGTVEKFEIQVSTIVQKTRTDRTTWYKRLGGWTDIKLIDVLLICESAEIKPIKFFTELLKRYYSEKDST